MASNKFCINLTNAKNDTDKATVAFVIGGAAAASDKETLVFLSTEGVRLALMGYADDIHEEGFSPLKELMSNYLLAGGKIWACSPCCKKRGIEPDQLLDGVTIVGGAKLVEFLSDGSPCISY
jgi:predicted peroxiredoxin